MYISQNKTRKGKKKREPKHKWNKWKKKGDSKLKPNKIHNEIKYKRIRYPIK